MQVQWDSWISPEDLRETTPLSMSVLCLCLDAGWNNRSGRSFLSSLCVCLSIHTWWFLHSAGCRSFSRLFVPHVLVHCCILSSWTVYCSKISSDAQLVMYLLAACSLSSHISFYISLLMYLFFFCFAFLTIFFLLSFLLPSFCLSFHYTFTFTFPLSFSYPFPFAFSFRFIIFNFITLLISSIPFLLLPLSSFIPNFISISFLFLFLFPFLLNSVISLHFFNIYFSLFPFFFYCHSFKLYTFSFSFFPFLFLFLSHPLSCSFLPVLQTLLTNWCLCSPGCLCVCVFGSCWSKLRCGCGEQVSREQCWRLWPLSSPLKGSDSSALHTSQTTMARAGQRHRWPVHKRNMTSASIHVK